MRAAPAMLVLRISARDPDPEPASFLSGAPRGGCAADPGAATMHARLRPKICFFAASLILVLAVSSASARPAGLDCPSQAAAPAGLSPADAEILKGDDNIALAGEINDIVNRLLLGRPGLSYAQLVNALIAAYCPIVAGRSDLSVAEKRDRMMRFAALARRQVSANALPRGSLIIANVPLPPEVYRRLAGQAAAQNQPIARFMEKILTEAAGAEAPNSSPAR
jgi:hypothetical protein